MLTTSLLRAALLAAIAPALSSCGRGAAARACPKAEPLLVAGKPTGLERCADGTLHRKESLACPSLLPRAALPGDLPDTGDCRADVDCKEKPHGYCTSNFQRSHRFCQYGCTTDAECGAGKACLCGDPVGYCAPASCTSDASCPGTICASFDASPGCGATQLACHTPQDTCQSSADCVGKAGDYCTPDLTPTGPGAWSCKKRSCTVGRPLLVAGEGVLASLVRAGGWG